MDDGSYTTVLTVSEEYRKQARRTIAIGSKFTNFSDYVGILTSVRYRAPGAHFDELTDSILNGKTVLRFASPWHQWLIAFIVIGAVMFALIIFYPVLIDRVRQLPPFIKSLLMLFY
jgi:hypothetical protein